MATNPTIPYTQNSLTLATTNKTGSSSNLAMSQKGVADLPKSTGALTDAPSDGSMYVRKNGAWVKIIAVEEAPVDGKQYVRQNGVWVATA